MLLDDIRENREIDEETANTINLVSQEFNKAIKNIYEKLDLNDSEKIPFILIQMSLNNVTLSSIPVLTNTNISEPFYHVTPSTLSSMLEFIYEFGDDLFVDDSLAN